VEGVVLDKLDSISKIIADRMPGREKDRDITSDFGHNPVVNKILENTVLTGMDVAEYIGGVNYFYIDGNCTGCGICQKVCLSGKITMKDNTPNWNRKVLCSMCFACLNYCPEQAVQISNIPGVKSYTTINGRYSHPYATVEDICRQKQKQDTATGLDITDS
jgi:ferredoxin